MSNFYLFVVLLCCLTFVFLFFVFWASYGPHNMGHVTLLSHFCLLSFYRVTLLYNLCLFFVFFIVLLCCLTFIFVVFFRVTLLSHFYLLVFCLLSLFWGGNMGRVTLLSHCRELTALPSLQGLSSQKPSSQKCYRILISLSLWSLLRCFNKFYSISCIGFLEILKQWLLPVADMSVWYLYKFLCCNCYVVPQSALHPFWWSALMCSGSPENRVSPICLVSSMVDQCL